PPQRLTRGAFHNPYWTVAQMIAHHTCNGCNLLVGDLIGSGTVSGPDKNTRGSLLELTARGRAYKHVWLSSLGRKARAGEPIALPTGEQRGFIEDGDEIIFKGYCTKKDYP